MDNNKKIGIVLKKNSDNSYILDGTYTFDKSEYIEGANGTYFVMVCARDNNGNESYNGFKITIVGGRELSDEEIDNLLIIQDEYRQFDLDVGVNYKNISSSGTDEIITDPNELNAMWRSVQDEEYSYLGFEIDYPKVINWGPLEAESSSSSSKKNETGSPSSS